MLATLLRRPDSVGVDVTPAERRSHRGPRGTRGSPWHRPRRALFATLLIAASCASVAIAHQATGAADAIVTRYPGTGISEANAITPGPDGALWFTNFGNSSIGRITTAGAVTNYTDPSILSPESITAVPDGALWFTNAGNNSIGRITTAGAVTNYTDPSIVEPQGITPGPDGALWFTNFGDSSIGRITTAGAVTSYTDPSILHPFEITAGPDGALWFANSGNNSIGRITTAGAVTNYTDPSISNPSGIAAGPDGAVWFTNQVNNSIGRITTAGAVTNYTDPSISNPLGITAGPDGAVWFTNLGNNTIGRITTGPSAPRSVTTLPSGNNAAIVTWNPPASTGSFAITGYVVTPYLEAVARSARTFDTTTTTEIIYGLTKGKTYRFAVAAFNRVGVGQASTVSNAMTVGAPGKPAKPTVTEVKSASLTVTFVAPATNGAAITAYTATCTSPNGGVAQTATGKASPLAVAGLSKGKRYACTVNAHNSRGTGPPSSASAAVNV